MLGQKRPREEKELATLDHLSSILKTHMVREEGNFHKLSSDLLCALSPHTHVKFFKDVIINVLKNFACVLGFYLPVCKCSTYVLVPMMVQREYQVP